MIKVGLDLLHAHPRIGGGWNYIQNLLRAFTFCQEQVEFVCYVNAVSESIVPNDPRFTKRHFSFDGRSVLRRLFYENVSIPLRCYYDRLDLIWFWGNNRSILSPKPTATVFHDLGLFSRQKSLRNLTQRSLFSFSARASQYPIAVSEFTAQELKLRWKSMAEIAVLSNPVPVVFCPQRREDVEAFCRKYDLPTDFWLFVSHYYPHKNHRRLFEAYARVRSQGNTWPLVLRGDTNGADELLNEWLQELRVDPASVIWLPRLTVQEMACLYNAASTMVFPSLFEGGGIPVMEAMACGCPVIASDIPTTREFCGDAVKIFNPNSTADLVRAMNGFSANSFEREDFKIRAIARARQFSESKVAQVADSIFAKL